jgi:hypothetical protein
MSLYNIRGIPPQSVNDLWRFAEPFIKRALDHTFGEVSADDIRQACENTQMQLWMITKESRVVGAGSTQIVIYPQMKVCRIVTLAGSEFDEWKDFAHMNLEMWAETQQGCSGMEAFCRKGFIPKLLEIGYRHKYSVAHKSLKGK